MTLSFLDGQSPFEHSMNENGQLLLDHCLSRLTRNWSHDKLAAAAMRLADHGVTVPLLNDGGVCEGEMTALGIERTLARAIANHFRPPPGAGSAFFCALCAPPRTQILA